MSKNPAWNAYNESVRLANDEYERTVKPLRAALSNEIAATETRFDKKIRPLVAERTTLLEKLKKDYAEKVVATEQTRREAVNRALSVRNAELTAKREEVEA